jgi:hypothetical protein
MLKRTFVAVAMVALTSGIAGAQAPKPVPAKPTPQPTEEKVAPKAPEPPAQPINIKLEVTITDQTGPGEASKKIVSMIVGDRQGNSIRSSATVPMPMSGGMPGVPPPYREVRINVDAHPILLKDNKISLIFGLEYLPQVPATAKNATERPAEGTASLNERLGLVLESGKPVVVSQAADPTSDRRITVELVATILK